MTSTPVPTPLSRYWALTPEELAAHLGSSAGGLSTAEAAQRLSRYGENALREREHLSALRVFLNQFRSPIIIILLVATVLSALLGDWIDAIIISIILLLSAVLAFVQEYAASSATAALARRVQTEARVLRDGQPCAIAAHDVVPGDVVLLSAGTLVAADAVLLQAHELHLSQAVLTGETFPVEKQVGPVSGDGLAERTNAVFMGTSVSSGAGTALVVHTGRATAFGQIADQLRLRPPETEFERGVRRLGYLLTQVMFVLVLVIYALNVTFSRPPVDSLLFSLALAVGLTPQLLPAVININLSKGARRMAESGVIVRRLSSIENFGSIDVLCTDKTGTLTLGVVQLDRAAGPDGSSSDDVLQAAAINARLQSGLANPLDEAILRAVPVPPAVTRIDELPYDFSRRRLSVAASVEGEARLLTKGAFESVLAVCAAVRQDGRDTPLDETEAQRLHDRFADWSAQGFRVLGVAAKAVPPDQRVFTLSDERELVFLGFLLFYDPPKPDAMETIQALAALGVSLRIITGDNRLVAAHLTRMLGMADATCLTGGEMASMPEEALIQRVNHVTVFAEVDPNQKERIIRALQKAGHVVGYMGDGVNDAPALHTADVGISVDTAVDVARQAAGFILLEHSLAVLQRGIIEGRKTLANTLKYVFMATSANFGNMFSMAGASLLLPFLPLLPKQILLLNFLTDIPELAIANDGVDAAQTQRPGRWDIHFVRRFMLVFGAISSVFDYVTFGALLLLLGADAGQFRTGWFIESMLSATLVVFALRTRQRFTRSRPGRGLILASLTTATVVLLLPYSPLAGMLGFEPLALPYLLAVIAISLVYFATAEAAKQAFYRRWG